MLLQDVIHITQKLIQIELQYCHLEFMYAKRGWLFWKDRYKFKSINLVNFLQINSRFFSSKKTSRWGTALQLNYSIKFNTVKEWALQFMINMFWCCFLAKLCGPLKTMGHGSLIENLPRMFECVHKFLQHFSLVAFFVLFSVCGLPKKCRFCVLL